MRWPVWTMITGAAVFIIGTASHNIISAVCNTEESVFFIIASIISPLIFVAGFAGYIIHAINKMR
jgi:hypothetical protein